MQGVGSLWSVPCTGRQKRSFKFDRPSLKRFQSFRTSLLRGGNLSGLPQVRKSALKGGAAPKVKAGTRHRRAGSGFFCALAAPLVMAGSGDPRFRERSTADRREFRGLQTREKRNYARRCEAA